MAIFYKVSDKQLLKDRNLIFKHVALPELKNIGFVNTPFLGSRHGEYDKSIRGYVYEISRLTNDNNLQSLLVYILNGEKWIQIYLNIFKLSPSPVSISALNKSDGIKFCLPPNSQSRMRLRMDDHKLPPIIYLFFLPKHKIGPFFTKAGYDYELNKLNRLIKLDMENIDKFVERWHELHKPILTDWEGNIIDSSSE